MKCGRNDDPGHIVVWPGGLFLLAVMLFSASSLDAQSQQNLSLGGRLEYTAVFDEDWRRTDDVAFVDLGGDFSFPLWFNVKGERAAMGFFVIPRYYINPAEIVGQDGFDLGVDSHLEIGASFQIHDHPKLWLIKFPKWYGIGARLAQNHRSLRIYLGFPF